MVGDAAGVAGAGVGAEGLLAGVDVVAGEEEGDSENAHGRSDPARRYIDMVDEVPLAVVFDGPLSSTVKVEVRRHQGELQETEDRIVGGVVEVAARNDSVDADGRQRIPQKPRK